MSHIANEVCIVTGAARGLGKAFATALRDAGGLVVTCDVLDGADEKVDVSQADDVRAFVDDVVARHGSIGIAVLNAGVCRFTNALDSSWEQTVDDFDFHVGTNLRGVFLAGRAVLPGMAARGKGNIVIIGTDHLCRPADFAYTAPVLDAYDASKWALMGLVNAWVNAAGSKGVRVNSLSMGATDSDMLRSFTKVATGKEPTQEMIDSWMRPGDVADLIVQMIEEGPEGRTSTNIPVILGRPIVLPPWTPAPPARPATRTSRLTCASRSDQRAVRPSPSRLCASYARGMAMNCKPVSTLDERINDLRMRTAEIVNNDILPNESRLWRSSQGDGDTFTEHTTALELRAEIREKVKQAGLWAPHLPKEYGGMGLDFLAHAYMNEVLAYAIGAASLFGVVAPNSGNQSILVKYGTEEQKQKWLLPLIEGTMESGFSMTEPHNPGSDPRSLDTIAWRDGDEWVINGHKWFTSNGFAADFLIVMCRVVENEGSDRRSGPMVQIIVPTNVKGVNIVRGIGVWGRKNSDHCEIKYENARVPVDNALGRVGTGHQAAQDRLGAGRIFHCMNSIGQMWRAFDLMVERTQSRQVHGGLLADKQFIQGFIADSYIDIQAARLMTLHAAEKIDGGLQGARTDISAIKIFVPAAYTRVVDRAIQVWGAAGVSNDLPLAGMYMGARTLRIADGPDEVHKILIAKNVLGQYAKGEGWDFGN